MNEQAAKTATQAHYSFKGKSSSLARGVNQHSLALDRSINNPYTGNGGGEMSLAPVRFLPKIA